MRGYFPGEGEYREPPQPRARRSRPSDPRDVERRISKPPRRIGRVLGVLLGSAAAVAFLFFGSEGTVDAPTISGVHTGKPAAHTLPAHPAGESR